MDVKEIWKKAMPIIENNVSSISFDLYIKPLMPEAFEDGAFILSANSTRDANYANNERHFPHIDYAVKTVAPIVEKITIIDAIEKEKRENKDKEPEAVQLPDQIVRHNTINPQQTFENFIVGRSNQEVAAAAEFTAKQPGKKINPLFIYGRSGLGKTHLLNAIANHIMENQPELKIILTSIQKFTKDYVEIIRQKGDFSAFREKYRNADVLLVDDMQEITNKQATQEEFFHTFNDLFEHNRQIIITSDRHPNEIATLAERMKSRFKGGLLQDIRNPDVETRIAILQKKSKLEGKFLPDDIASIIAEHSFNINENIRDMEGRLFKIIFYAELNDRTIPTLEDCKSALANEDNYNSLTDSGSRIIATVGSYFNIAPDDLTGKRRTDELAYPRMVAAYIMTEKLNDVPLTEVGEMLGGRTHASVIYSRDKIATQMKKDEKLKTAIDDIMAQLNK